MSKSPTITATPRTRLGSRYAARLRKENQVPAVVYGHKEAPAHVTVNGVELAEALHSDAHLFSLTLGGATQPCLVKDVQWDTFGRSVIHVDLARVSLDEVITLKVDVILVGECAALKNVGTSILRPTASVSISCKAKDIPNSVALDISALAQGHSLFASDLTLPAGVTCVDAPKTVLATISVGKDEVVAAPAEGTAAATPEVIKKGKEEEGKEGEAKPAAGGKAAPAAAAKPAAKK